MKKLLFVDDEPNILEGLERMLFPLRKEWQLAFAHSGHEALNLMKEKPFDVIVTDLRMPGMDGATLLSEVREHHPGMVRFVLSGQSDEKTGYRAASLAHQFLPKPCDAKTLKAHVDSAFALRELLSSDGLKRVIGQADTLPALPKVYTALLEELETEEASVATVGKIIESDAAMTAKILQLVNSAFFGLSRQVGSAMQAVSLLGLDTVKALVLVTGVFSRAEGKSLPAPLSLDALWQHSLTVGKWSQAIAKAEKSEGRTVGDAHTAGVLHDAGRLLLAVHLAAGYRHVLEAASSAKMPLVEAEREMLGCTHAEVGAYLLGIWGLPDPIIQAVAFHHNPGLCPATAFGPLTAVHAADGLLHEAGPEAGGWGAPGLDFAYIDRLGLAGRVDDWRSLSDSVRSDEG